MEALAGIYVLLMLFGLVWSIAVFFLVFKLWAMCNDVRAILHRMPAPSQPAVQYDDGGNPIRSARSRDVQYDHAGNVIPSGAAVVMRGEGAR